MKKIIYALFLICLTASNSFGQACGTSGPTQCTATGTLIIPGLSPRSDSLAAFTNGIASTTVIQFKNFNQVVFPPFGTLTVQSLRIDSIQNLPAGLCWSTDRANNTYGNQESGCIKINGTPCGDPGQYKLRIIVTVNVGITQQVNAETAGLKYFVRLGNLNDVVPEVDTLQTIPVYKVGYSTASQCSPVLCQPFSFTQSTTGNTSCSSPNGTISVTATGGTAPYSYKIGSNTSANGAFITMQGGTYNVVATDDSACTSSVSVTVATTTAVIALSSVSNTPVTSCTTTNGALTVSASGGTGPYTYTLGSTTNFTGVFTGLTSGSKTITVVDANNCNGTLTVTIANNAPFLSATLGTNTPQTSCTGSNGALSITATGGTSPYNYTQAGTTNTTGAFTGLSAGTKTINYTDAGGCSGSFTATIMANLATVTATTSTINASAATATDGTATALGAGGTAPYVYTWSNAQTNDTATGLVAGTYTVTVADANGCSVVKTVVVSFTSGVNTLATELTSIRIFPNPAVDKITVNAQLINSKNVSIEIYSALGEKITSRNTGLTTKVNENFDVKGLAKGTYFVRISTGEKQATYSIVIQ